MMVQLHWRFLGRTAGCSADDKKGGGFRLRLPVPCATIALDPKHDFGGGDKMNRNLAAGLTALALLLGLTAARPLGRAPNRRRTTP